MHILCLTDQHNNLDLKLKKNRTWTDIYSTFIYGSENWRREVLDVVVADLLALLVVLPCGAGGAFWSFSSPGCYCLSRAAWHSCKKDRKKDDGEEEEKRGEK